LVATLLVLLTALLVHGCSESDSGPGSSLRSPVAEEGVGLGHLETGRNRVTISSVDGEIRYTVRSSSGELLAADLTEKELERRYPELHDATQLMLKTPQIGYVE
jgi:hypothetical protein